MEPDTERELLAAIQERLLPQFEFVNVLGEGWKKDKEVGLVLDYLKWHSHFPFRQCYKECNPSPLLVE
jgi:hypothetical protein